MSGSHLFHHHPEIQAVADRPAGLRFMYVAPVSVKLAATLGLIVFIMSVPATHARWLWAPAGILVVAAAFSVISLWFVLQRLLVLLPFLASVWLIALVRPDAVPEWQMITAKSLLALSAVILLSATTPFSALLGALRRARMPALLLTTIALMYRYLFVLADEAERMRRARASRTFVLTRRFTWAVLSTVGGRLFVRSSERADRIYHAMCARGWQ